MEYTANYHLPQWVESDRIMMGDFNEAMDGIDQGIASAQAVADAAQSAADTAQTAAEAAQTTADAAFCPDYMPYVIGKYKGEGSGSKTITLGFTPSMVIISGEVHCTDPTEYGRYTAITSGSGEGIHNAIEITKDGFTINGSGSYYPILVDATKTYRYIAFR